MPDPGFDALYRSQAPVLAGYLTRLTGDPGLAEDLCQETFSRLLQRGPADPHLNGATGAWLFKVATNLARDRWRARRPETLRDEPVDEATDGARAAAARDAQACVRAEVGRLPFDLREVFLMRAHHGLSFAAIGGAIGASDRTAKERFRRAREILAHRLRDLIEE